MNYSKNFKVRQIKRKRDTDIDGGRNRLNKKSANTLSAIYFNLRVSGV